MPLIPNAAALHEALGLTLVRQGRKLQALIEFAAATKAAPEQARYAYIYAIALSDAGRRAEAMRLLEAAAQRRGDRDVLLALVSFKIEAGDRAGAEKYLDALAAMNPDDPAVAHSAARRWQSVEISTSSTPAKLPANPRRSMSIGAVPPRSIPNFELSAERRVRWITGFLPCLPVPDGGDCRTVEVHRLDRPA